MEDLTFGMSKPSIIDIKIGRRLFDIDASPEKVFRRTMKAETTTSGSLGFRICGVKAFTVEGEPVLHKKQDLMSLTEAGVITTLQLYFSALSRTHRTHLSRLFLSRLRHILQIIQTSSLQLISSSVLLVYDLDDPGRATCKIIDFAHSHLHTDTAHLDENYIHGLASLIGFMESVVA